MEIIPFLFLISVLSVTKMNADESEDSSTKETRSDRRRRIIGGYDARQEMFPWMVALYRFDSYICSAFIISNTTVMGAAHCFFRKGKPEMPKYFHAIAGNVNRTAKKVRIDFKSIHIHPGYNPKDKSLNNDLALLETRDAISFKNDNIDRVCVAKYKKRHLFQKALAMGWGSTEPEGEGGYPDILQYTELKTVPSKLCPTISVGDKSKICALKRHTGLCHGDSGGPLVRFDRDGPVAIGVASHIQTLRGCGTFLRLGVYMKISYYLSFLKKYSRNICEI